MSDDRTENQLSVAAAELLSQAQAKAAELQASLDASREHADAQYRRAEQLQKKVDALTAPAEPEGWPKLPFPLDYDDGWHEHDEQDRWKCAVMWINSLLAHARQCQARIVALIDEGDTRHAYIHSVEERVIDLEVKLKDCGNADE